jgi:hypothetical protein
MAPAKTAQQRVSEARARRSAAGLVRLDLWVHPDDREAIKEHAAKLQRSRERAAKKALK